VSDFDIVTILAKEIMYVHMIGVVSIEVNEQADNLRQILAMLA
jgi:hypothetical protein